MAQLLDQTPASGLVKNASGKLDLHITTEDKEFRGTAKTTLPAGKAWPLGGVLSAAEGNTLEDVYNKTCSFTYQFSHDNVYVEFAEFYDDHKVLLGKLHNDINVVVLPGTSGEHGEGRGHWV